MKPLTQYQHDDRHRRQEGQSDGDDHRLAEDAKAAQHKVAGAGGLEVRVLQLEDERAVRGDAHGPGRRGR